VPSVWVEQFENVLAVLEEVTGVSLSSFKPTTAVRGAAYDRDVLKMKIDAVLTLLNERFGGGSSESRPIGFRP
jgi:hypothetical protein